MEIFAKRLKELRLENGYTQQKVAEIIGIKQQSYARYEADTGEPSLQTVVKIARLYGVASDYLLGLSDC